jgi:hypothetical protein
MNDAHSMKKKNDVQTKYKDENFIRKLLRSMKMKTINIKNQIYASSIPRVR